MDVLSIPKKIINILKVSIQLSKKMNYNPPRGLDTANALIKNKNNPLEVLKVVRHWMARHGPDASHGGTSYRGYQDWIKSCYNSDGTLNKKIISSPTNAALAWLVWGGDDMYLFLKSPKIHKLLIESFPKHFKPDRINRLKNIDKSNKVINELLEM